MRTATFRIKSASWLVIECEWIFRTRFRQQQLIIFLIINIIKMKHINVSTCISMRGVRVRVLAVDIANLNHVAVHVRDGVEGTDAINVRRAEVLASLACLDLSAVHDAG